MLRFGPLQTEPTDREFHYRLVVELEAIDDLTGTRFLVPAGFVTDFASVPRALWWLMPPWGRYMQAAALHDWLYAKHLTSRTMADAYFREGMRVLGVPLWKRWLMWAAVRCFGFGPWKAAAR